MYRLLIVIIILGTLVSATAAQSPVDFDQIKADAEAQIVVDMEALDVPEGSTPELQMHLVRNKRISAAYSIIYLQNPDLNWMGLAALASDLVGQQLTSLQEQGAPSLFPEQYQAIADGNKGVYDDIYWQHVAYVEGGIEAMEAAGEEGLITEMVVESWREIDKGTEEGLYQGAYLMVAYEQEFVLQPIVYADHVEFYAASTALVDLNSPVPNHDVPFTGANIAELDLRMDWMVNDITAEWFMMTDEQVQLVLETHIEFIIRTKDETFRAQMVDTLCDGDADCISNLDATCDIDADVACYIDALGE